MKPPNGWVKGNFDGFPGERIYPAWNGALDGKRLLLQDVRMVNGEYFIHSPWHNKLIASFADIASVEAYIMEHGRPIPEGTNVWD